MTERQVHRLLIAAIVVAILSVAVIIIVGCTIVIGDSNKVEQEINTESHAKGRLSVEDSANAKADTKADNRAGQP